MGRGGRRPGAGRATKVGKRHEVLPFPVRLLARLDRLGDDRSEIAWRLIDAALEHTGDDPPLQDARVKLAFYHELHGRVDAWAKRHDISRAEAIRELIARGLDLGDADEPSDAIAPSPAGDPPAETKRQALARLDYEVHVEEHLLGELEVARAMLKDLIDLVTTDVDALRAWQKAGGTPPRALTDPAGLVPLVGTIARIVETIKQGRFQDAMTASEAFDLFRQMANLTRKVIFEELSGLETFGLNSGPVGDRIVKRMSEGWRDLSEFPEE